MRTFSTKMNREKTRCRNGQQMGNKRKNSTRAGESGDGHTHTKKNSVKLGSFMKRFPFAKNGQ